MNMENDVNTERRLHQLICGETHGEETRRLLRLVTEDEGARSLLRRMLLCQEASRQAFGLHRCPEPSRELLDSVASRAAAGRRDRRWWRRVRSHGFRWAWRIAAAVAIAVSAALALEARHSSRELQTRLAKVERDVRPPGVTAGELAQYRRIWQEIAGPGVTDQPLVLLREDGGRLEYLSALQGEQTGKLLMVRCWLVAEDGQTVEQMNLLLPRRKLATVSLPGAGRLGGRDVQCNLTTDERWVSLGLDVADGSLGPVGVGGRVRLGQDASEIGRFRLEGRPLRVFLQAVTLEASVG
jgi:hypothetical protein